MENNLVLLHNELEKCFGFANRVRCGEKPICSPSIFEVIHQIVAGLLWHKNRKQVYSITCLLHGTFSGNGMRFWLYLYSEELNKPKLGT